MGWDLPIVPIPPSSEVHTTCPVVLTTTNRDRLARGKVLIFLFYSSISAK